MSGTFRALGANFQFIARNDRIGALQNCTIEAELYVAVVLRIVAVNSYRNFANILVYRKKIDESPKSCHYE